ncbi:MAG: asparagine--tRNA ligase [Nitrospinaceae bacterium]|nr:asparagine--tRNA ligase [Nitrospinaceae bacterium]NIR55723.1 asparagine--tRNA ligase [Nitrospinaceae bacterium]NIS86163.1 asparagine--tRNA ligase [Nitrospinaceae bacterium]NIT80467.1 asparagine--tRNA ligase [Nitrospinaceae bacterium]NIU45211.1 asparagine--tRNA ligase [Nitrospinaceae bacterium]
MNKIKRSPVKELLAGQPRDGILIQGWVRTRRDSKGGFSFIEINDGSCLKNIQVIVDHQLESFKSWDHLLTTGSCVAVYGNLVASQGKGQSVEVQATAVQVYGTADPEKYPLQKKFHSLEFLRDIAHLRPRTNTLGAVMRVRNRLAYAIHHFFHERGFVYLHTPIITTSDCEGAGEMFQVTTLDIADPPKKEGAIDYHEDFFGQKTSLTVSGQLEAEIYALALSLVYTFGPTFRAENSNTSRHLAEFWMIEPEMAFYDLDDNMDLAEEFVKYLFKDVLEHCHGDLEFFNQRVDKHLLETLTQVVENDFERIPYSQAIHILEKTSEKFEYSVEWGCNLQAEHERYIVEKVLKKPVIIYNYPESIKPFYMKVNDDGETVRAMDVLLPRLGEIIGGSQREDDYETLARRIEAKGLDPKEYAWYLDLRRFGSAPHSGFGLGFERLVQFTTGVENIRDAIPFPRTPKQAGF